jgi:hypothetical protein
MYISAFIQPQQGKLNSGMAGISVQLSRIWSKKFAKQVRVLLHGSEQLVVFEQRIVCESGLN